MLWIGYETFIHHVHMDSARPAALSLGQLIAQAGKIARQNRWSELQLDRRSPFILELAISADQVVGRTIMAELGLGLAL
jgi:hypothetical protein